MIIYQNRIMYHEKKNKSIITDNSHPFWYCLTFFLQMVPHLFAIVSREVGDDRTRGHIPFFPLLSSRPQRVDQERANNTL